MHLLLSILTALAVLHLPKDKLEQPLLFGSRIVDVNQSYGKVFAPGQRNPHPVVMHFEALEGGEYLMLRPHRARQNQPYRIRNKELHPLAFRILEETDSCYCLELLPTFSTYPRVVSAIPPKMLPGHAVEFEILDVKESDRYLQVDGHYQYSDGLDVTAACYFIWLDEPPMPGRLVNDTRAGYNHVDIRGARDKKLGRSYRWNLTPGRVLDFYVDKAFPAEWYPYIKEGIEDWNQAFRAIGMGDVLAVHPEPEGLDTTSPLVNMVRYMDVEESNAKGDVLVDPRSGEILQGDILWWKNVVRLMEDWRYVQTGAADPEARLETYPIEFLGPMIRHAVCHEMGHVLGLSHNMGASWAYPADSLRSPSFTQNYGTSASVMDYARYNHLATAEDIRAGVNLLPPRLGPYDYFAIACGYAEKVPEPGPYCYFAPFISAAISPDPSSQAESLGNDLLRSSRTGRDNCRALLSMDGLSDRRKDLLSKQYYRYIQLSLSNIGGVVEKQPVPRMTRRETLRFVLESLDTVPRELADTTQQQSILDELVGNFLPERVLKTAGEKELKDYYRQLRRLRRKYPELPLKDPETWKYNH